MGYRFYNSCIGWPRGDVHTEGGLCDMVADSRMVCRRTMLSHIGKDKMLGFERMAGYARHWKQGLTMSQDWYVTYHRSKLHGRRVYYIRHSAIEYVFTKD